MLIDERTSFAYGVALAGAAGTAKLGMAIDLSVAADQGEGYPMYLVIGMSAAAAGGTSVAFNLVTADNAALDLGNVTLLSTPAIATADLGRGALAIVAAIPKAAYKRYLGITATKVGIFSAGSVYAFLTQDPPAWRAYPEGNN